MFKYIFRYKTLLIVFTILLFLQSSYAYKLLNEQPQRGYFFYKCPEGYQEVGVFHKCVKISENDNLSNEVQDNQTKEQEKVVEKKEDKKAVNIADKKDKKDEKEVVAVKEKPKNYDGETFEFPIREDIKRVPAIYNFLMHPENEEYAKNFLSWQYQYMMHLKKISFGLSNVVNKYGPEVYPIKGYPASIHEDLLNQARQYEHDRQVLAKLKDKIGVFFFFSQTCPICKAELPIIEKFVREYGFTIRGILPAPPQENLPLPDNFPYVYNPELYEQFGVTHVPTLVLVYHDAEKNETDVKFIGSGAITLDTIIRGIYQFAEIKGLLKGIDLNPVRDFMNDGLTMGVN